MTKIKRKMPNENKAKLKAEYWIEKCLTARCAKTYCKTCPVRKEAEKDYGYDIIPITLEHGRDTTDRVIKNMISSYQGKNNKRKR
jgi:hypothetical protein